METLTKYAVKEVLWPGKTFVTKRTKTSFDKLGAFFSESYGAIYEAIKKLGIKTNEPPCAIYYSVDEARNETDLAAAVPVPESVQAAEGFQKVTIPRSEALLLTYYGAYENMGAAYTVLEKYASDHQLHKEWVLEEYFSDPSVEKDPEKWKTNIYFIMKHA